MPRLEYFLVAESVVIDQATNRVSAFHILEDAPALKFPAVIPQAAALTLWNTLDSDTDQDFQSLLRIQTPGGAVHEVTTNFTMRSPRHRITQRIEGLPLEGPGTLRFEVHLNGKYIASHEVIVGLAASDSPDGSD